MGAKLAEHVIAPTVKGPDWLEGAKDAGAGGRQAVHELGPYHALASARLSAPSRRTCSSARRRNGMLAILPQVRGPTCLNASQ